MQTVSNGVNQAPPAPVKVAIKQSNGGSKTKDKTENVKHTFDKKGDWSLMTATR